MRNVVAFTFLPAEGLALNDKITARIELGFWIGEFRRR